MKFALSYIEQGFSIVPLESRSKSRFLTEHGFNDASKDREQVIKWFQRWPNANIAIATGEKSKGLIVLDFDLKPDLDINGLDYLREWERQNGELPPTIEVISASGGTHLYYQSDLVVDSTQGLFDSTSGVDIRGEGGCIIAPPSIGPSGKRYIFECSSYDNGLARADDQVFKFIIDGMQYKKEQKIANGNRFTLPEQILQGERDDVMFRLACSLLAKGVDDEKALMLMFQVNQENCLPPLPEHTIRKKLKSALRLREKGR
ncbi:bifunctional DNA primase/polymerase [Parasporobacterium paucivorans]|nr:bifunctional DNA primase/polymerase [Parasporobacterium paucivorans]